MTLYQKMLVFYAIMGVICAVISWFLTKESRMIRLLAALLIGATWPF
ncbi:TPA: GhoT/OrtT family toxin, partial [Klebsiella pneumoniae subsp. pneumoniae]|nr:GhoT/OrtT family toxin [Klebsiella pneumoniae subsp. pneumoniae]